MTRDDEPVLGIDLGTTFSAMARVNQYGKAEIVPNAEGKSTTPSIVHFYEEEAFSVGDEATNFVVADAQNVVRFIKRHMGEEDFALEFWGRSYRPQEISAIILQKLKRDAEELLGTEVKDAVITVPAYFQSPQRGATAEAGAIAGLNVLSIINEPTAAAIAFGLDRLGNHRNLVVLDLGGGTFDVTVMSIEGTSLRTIAVDGNAELGGKDWDDRLLDYVAGKFFQECRLDPRDDPTSYQELYERILSAKISLSTKPRSVVPVHHRGRRLSVQVERETFESLTRELVDQCAEVTQMALNKANLGWRSIHDVLLVGGATRMPMIQDLVRRMSGREPSEGVNPDESVAVGAALAGVFRHRPNHPALVTRRTELARRNRPADRPAAPVEAAPSRDPAPRGAVIGLAGGGHVAEAAATAALPDVRIEDATSHPLGIIVLDRSRNERVVELIPEGTRLPHEFRGRFAYAYENMTAVRVEVTEGAGRTREEVTVIGKVELTGLPPRPKGTPIEVIYSYGVDQILSVQVVDVESGLSRRVDIRFRGGMTQAEVAAARERHQRYTVD